ncbi:TPA: restriction endonuclease subunit S, partial [Staphylococcus aureus]|nr:restriction endonuclease subunit S [Staphylococcus aureus]HDR0133851.1 restriction endonuclease subunit S [Staphylococcus aureus]
KKINWEKYDESTSVPSLSKVNIEKLKVYSCELEEQRKIGDFFSKLDRQIELEEQKLAKLEEQKKGYMQKLFSQELRFKTKDNVYYSEWQLHKLGEIFKYSQGKQISVDKQFSVKSNEMKRFIRIVDITENPEPRFVLYESDTGLVNKEDLFMIRYGRPGIVSIGFEGIIANNLFKLIPKIKISTVYFYYLLSYNYYRINLLTNQSTMPALNFKSLDSLKFKIPSYKEQNKIGNFFTKFDELIEKQNKKIDGLKERKKGLLQKMFV